MSAHGHGDHVEDVLAAQAHARQQTATGRSNSDSTAATSMAHSLPGCADLGLPPLTMPGSVRRAGGPAAADDPGLLSDAMFRLITK